ncbi:unnamed protein product [marine sediment metagenome]|uniref:Uncharacterized protein n=1 Tax=marine sediment metagenome TaxID=412755 RepID=X1SIW8_9ZZZZ
MEYTEHYDNMTERNSLCDVAHNNGLRMLHDNFDEDWQRGDEPHGMLTFTDEPPEQAPIEPIRDFGAEIDKLKDKVSALAKK